ncbi:gamma-glutamyl-gamma-aminobutyrate hydrolase family protein [Devosia sp. PTR5]|jgi:GMP synthase-like glutamine amidotransferase|uniref:Gamma-glutamyl-gamma-aminobutyrate hydrolase family protein n=1 Tax=Devosia oryzisoli TaxID=2774138 RepID=A0A927FV36_9HYPH|nr:gamma-glutamyl-gamma-aminobutyrate hydrolase family protein [Devosia oryzisoli]MBD8066865.1 gamma-glutamyl-gamma-aminobutyrate hydrolase family protein [Devosia oryzisoli]
MHLTILQTGDVPQHLQPRFANYPQMFRHMFASGGGDFSFSEIDVRSVALPDAAALEGLVITGSPAGVYEDHAWLDPLRTFIRAAYEAETPMLGICFGHQIMADALGGTVEKSGRGWGLGRHLYRVEARPHFLAELPDTIAVACSHQDQVVLPPPEAEVVLASAFAPYAGLLYKTGKALSFQPHPEFDDAYAKALVDLRRGNAPETVIEEAIASFATPSDSMALRRAIVRFFADTA